LTSLRGKQLVEQWQSQVKSGELAQVVRELLSLHYDPTYFASMKRNFLQIEQAAVLQAQNRSQTCFTDIAKQLVEADTP